MASWNGEQESDEKEEDSFMKPTPAQKMLVPQPPTEICPDSEENVKEQTEDLFRNFAYQRYRNDIIQQTYDNNPVNHELISMPNMPDSQAAILGRQIARIGDDINRKYKDEFSTVVRSMHIAPEVDSAYEAFADVARGIFAEDVNWGRVVTLLVFGYHLTIQTLRNQSWKCADLLKRISQFMLRYLVTSRISRWIADNGGWRAALTLNTSVSSGTMATIVGLAAASVAAVVAWKNYF